jgi:hypothetical protein
MAQQVITFSAHVLFRMATLAYQRLPAVDDLTPIGDRQPAVAILFAAISAEAVINEIGGAARHAVRPAPTPEIVQLGADLQRHDRWPTTMKWQHAYFLLTHGRHRIECDVPAYPDLPLLMEARNAIVHHKPATWEGESPDGAVPQHNPLLGRLRSRSIVATVPGFDLHDDYPIVQLLSTRAAARWACDTTSAVVRALLAVMSPRSHCLRMLEGAYGDHFRPADTFEPSPLSPTTPPRARKRRSSK